MTETSKPMRKRGAIFILAAMPAWMFFFHFVNEARRSPFGYELGSVAGPYPLQMRAAVLFALICTIGGGAFLAFDFVHWIRKR
jgi:hypothetical protein